ncbi:hypothetical protein CsSME_00034225 [Camellia sinensis var. sinensis]
MLLEPRHLLELVLLTAFSHPGWNEHSSLSNYTVRNVSELAFYGIELKPNKQANSCLADVRFANGLLTIPPLVIQESTTSLIMNLFALEQCPSSAVHIFASYLMLIDT